MRVSWERTLVTISGRNKNLQTEGEISEIRGKDDTRYEMREGRVEGEH